MVEHVNNVLDWTWWCFVGSRIWPRLRKSSGAGENSGLFLPVLVLECELHEQVGV